MVTKSLQEYKTQAENLHNSGYNCAQSTLLPFAQNLGMDEETITKFTAGLGAGLGCREVCGVVNALAIAQGLRINAVKPQQKVEALIASKKCADQFIAINGNLRCADLKGVPGKKTCGELISDGVEILYNILH